MAVGPGGTVDGKEVKMEVKVGDNVIYSKYAGTDVKIEEDEFYHRKTERYSGSDRIVE